MVTDYFPSRGDIIWLDLDPQSGHEQAGRRPVVVISPQEYNKKTRLALICPITRQEKGYPFEVKIPEKMISKGSSGEKVNGVILSDHIKNVDWQSRKAKFICK